MEHEHPRAYYTDIDWRKRRAPVVPPLWVTERVAQTQESVEWNNTQRVGNCDCCEWPMLYLTELEAGEVVTRLMPGSVEPVAGWLFDAHGLKRNYLIQVVVLKKDGIPDPEAREVERKSARMDVVISNVLFGKLFEITIEAYSEEEARARIDAMCTKLLANQYIERHEIVSVHPG